jgi:hypothetical protein
MAPRQRLVAIHPVHGYVIAPPQDLKTMKRNARERNRVLTVNQSFEALRCRIPSAAGFKKLSKVNIIQHAMDYIHGLLSTLEEDDLVSSSSPVGASSPQADVLTYPEFLGSACLDLRSPDYYSSPSSTDHLLYERSPSPLHPCCGRRSPDANHGPRAGSRATITGGNSCPPNKDTTEGYRLKVDSSSESHVDSCRSHAEDEDVLNAIIDWQYS